MATAAGAGHSRALADRARNGDADAFGELYRLHAADVRRYLARRLPRQVDAEDLAQEVFVRAWRRMPAFEWQAGGFGAWLVTIARNLVFVARGLLERRPGAARGLRLVDPPEAADA